jgi:hypothetical protein
VHLLLSREFRRQGHTYVCYVDSRALEGQCFDYCQADS